MQKIQFIPTELNFINYTKRQLNKIKNNCNLSRFLILSLILWNLILTYKVFDVSLSNPAPKTTPAQDELIIQLEEIPTENEMIRG